MSNMSFTQKYFFFVFSVIIMVSWAASLVYISNYLAVKIGVDPLELLGSGSVLGPKKIKALEYLVNGGAILIAASYILTLTRQGRLPRLAAVAIATPLILATHSWLNVVPLGRAQERIEITRLPTVNYDAIFNDRAIKRNEITSYGEFIAAVDANYDRHRQTLREIWTIKDEGTLRSLFYLNTVANLYSFGNANPNSLGGCAQQNEQFGSIVRSRGALGVRFFLDSKIGCCTDYALVLKLLLDSANIESNIVEIPLHGHIFNEVLLEGKWRALDANIGAIYDRTWNDIVATKDPFSVTVFPVVSLSGAQSSRYRPILAQFRHKTLMVAATGAEYTRDMSANALNIVSK